MAEERHVLVIVPSRKRSNIFGMQIPFVDVSQLGSRVNRVHRFPSPSHPTNWAGHERTDADRAAVGVAAAARVADTGSGD